MRDPEPTQEAPEERNAEPLPDVDVASVTDSGVDGDVSFDTPKDLDRNPAPPQGND